MAKLLFENFNKTPQIDTATRIVDVPVVLFVVYLEQLFVHTTHTVFQFLSKLVRTKL